jgi:hypothetical protein
VTAAARILRVWLGVLVRFWLLGYFLPVQVAAVLAVVGAKEAVEAGGFVDDVAVGAADER